MSPLRSPSRRHVLSRGGLHYLSLAVARCALRARDHFDRPWPMMLLMAGGTPVLHRIGFVKGVGPLAQIGMTTLAAVIDFLDTIGRSAFLKAVSHYIGEFLPGQTVTGNEGFVVAGITVCR